MYHRLTLGACALGPIVAATGCGASGDTRASTATVTVTQAASPSSSPATSSSTTTTPSVPEEGDIGVDVPPEISKAAAGKEYLAIVKPFNKALTNLTKAAAGNIPETGPISRATLERLRPLSKKLADENRTFSLNLMQKSQRWPFEAADTARTLATEVTRQQRYYRNMATAETPQEWTDAWNAWPEVDNSAELLRQQLGLPERG